MEFRHSDRSLEYQAKVEAFLDETKRAVVRGEKVAVSGFGVFESQARVVDLAHGGADLEALDVLDKSVENRGDLHTCQALAGEIDLDAPLIAQHVLLHREGVTTAIDDDEVIALDDTLSC